jgi:hypothetical protein
MDGVEAAKPCAYDDRLHALGLPFGSVDVHGATTPSAMKPLVDGAIARSRQKGRSARKIT